MQYKYIILGSIAGIVLVSQARAQDRWAGGYWGLSLDGIEAKADVEGSAVHTYEDNHATFGAHLGYNFVRDNGFVWGPEVSLHGVSSEGAKSDTILGDTGFTGSFLLASKVRAGWANEQMFFYGTLGLEMSDVRVQPIGTNSTDLSLGLSAGVGMEYAVTDLWSTRIEISKINYSGAEGTYNLVKRDHNASLGRVSIGISRKF